jgi:hypothetical protein
MYDSCKMNNCESTPGQRVFSNRGPRLSESGDMRATSATTPPAVSPKTHKRLACSVAQAKPRSDFSP